MNQRLENWTSSAWRNKILIVKKTASFLTNTQPDFTLNTRLTMSHRYRHIWTSHMAHSGPQIVQTNGFAVRPESRAQVGC